MGKRSLDSNITTFLLQGPITFSDIYELLDEQFQRLSDLEKQVSYWLFIKNGRHSRHYTIILFLSLPRLC
ncbi:MAG: hypothetical protein KME43_03565 [Myxacorys chilensis ATA2-1-KO14]|nr:hypothetical protein [Myxacorys chilensis ATA2-1-KO14]